MNAKSEQLTSDLNVIYDFDEPLTAKELREKLLNALGENAYLDKIGGKNVVVYSDKNDSKIILMAKAITYLGNPHPLFKKRIQIPKEWLEYSINAKELGYEIRFIGIYHYKQHCILVDFETDSYLKHKCNNSAAHVYINDLYQGRINGFFKKIDKNKNVISKSKSPGNDQQEFRKCLEKYGRFWYVIYEHETIKDSAKGFEATLFRSQFIHEKDQIPLKKGKELSYCQRMKHSVKFVNMFIIELNPINVNSILRDFHQGRQSDGKKRNLKFLINKGNIDNFVIYRYNGKGGNK